MLTERLPARSKQRIHLRAFNLLERRILRHNVFKQRIVIKHIHNSRKFLQTNDQDCP